MTSSTPLNITLSIGDVSFHLTPSSPNNNNALLSPSATSSPSQTAAPYATHRRRNQMRRSGLLTPRSLNNQQQQQHSNHNNNHVSPPIVAIRHGSTADSSSLTNNLMSPAVGKHRQSPSPQRPLQQHIRGRVRAMKDRIEPPRGSNSNIGTTTNAEHQAPLFSTAATNNNNSNDYCVDLNNFTGTLHISSKGITVPSQQQNDSLQSSSMQPINTNSWGDNITSPRPMFSNRHSMMNHHSSSSTGPNVMFSSRKRIARDETPTAGCPDYKENDDTNFSPSKKRSASSSSNSSNNNKKESFTWIASNDNDEVEVGRISDAAAQNVDLLANIGTTVSEESAVSTSQVVNVVDNCGRRGAEKAVRFSMLHQNSIIDPLSVASERESHSRSSLSNDEESQIKQPSSTCQSTALISSPQQQQQIQRFKSKHFFSSPPMASFSSPPKKALANTLRETSTMLARSSKHVFNQVTLAGAEVLAAAAAAQRGGDGAGGGLSTRQGSDGTSDIIDSNRNGNDDGDQVYDAIDGTELHYACASDSLDHVRCLLEYDSLEELHKADCTGKLPIHVFANNQRLINSDPLGCEEVAFTMIELMGPEKAIQSLHPSGLAPFVYIISMWTDKLYRDVMLGSSTMMGMRMSTTNKSDMDDYRPSVTAGSSSSNNNSTSPTRPARRLPYRSLFHSTVGANDKSIVSSTNRAKLLYLPTNVTIPSHVRWGIHILSRLIDEYPEQTRESILTNIASVPLFLKSILLVGDTDEMAELLDSTLVKHVVVDKRSINVWLCAMLTDTRDVKMRAVSFIKLLSRLNLHDLACNSHSPSRYSDEEIERFTILREGTFNAVYVQPGIVPAVLELGGHVIENISTTRVMRYITDRTIRKESVFFVLILDFFYSIFLLMGYRLNVEFVLNYQHIDGPDIDNYNERRYVSTSTMGIAGYFLVKEALTLLSLYLTSTKLAKRYCTSIFNVIDVVSVVMLLFTESILSTDPNLLDNEGFGASLTIILLWLKLMGSFKVLNSAFALFLYAVNEVIKDVKWFILFLFAITLMFSDAARTIVAARGDCQYNIDGNQYVADEFCSDQLLAVIIRMYSVLVGDVALEYFQSSDAMVAVFVFFSFFSIIILLNILVAIIIDSYDTSKKRSREIFYRARIEYAAHLVARKQFLTPKECSDFHVATYIPQTARASLRFFYILVIVVAFCVAEYGFVGMVHFLMLESKDDYRMIRSLVIIYVCVGSIFNAYVMSVGLISLFKRYDKRFHQLKLLGGDSSRHSCHDFIEKIVHFLEVAVKMFHGILGFNAERTANQNMVDVTEEFLITDGEGK